MNLLTKSISKFFILIDMSLIISFFLLHQFILVGVINNTFSKPQLYLGNKSVKLFHQIKSIS